MTGGDAQTLQARGDRLHAAGDHTDSPEALAALSPDELRSLGEEYLGRTRV